MTSTNAFIVLPSPNKCRDTHNMQYMHVEKYYFFNTVSVEI